MKERIKKALGIEGTVKKTVLPMIGYASGNILFGGGNYIINLYFLTFLTEVEKLTASQAGFVMMVPIFWDAITDPIMGVITDRTRSRFGKHRRYFLWGIVPIMVSYFMLWSSFGISAAGNAQNTMIYYIIALMLYKTAFTLVSVPHTAMLPAIAPGYFERTQYTSVSYLMNSVGMVSSFVVVSASLGFLNMDLPGAELRPTYMKLGLVLCLWFSLPLLATFFGTKEPSSLDLKPPPVDVQHTLGEFVQVFRNRAFRQYFFLTLCFRVAQGFYSNSDQYFILYLTDNYSKFNLLMTVSGAAEAAGFPLNYALVKKFGKQFSGKLLTPLMVVGILMNLLISNSLPPWLNTTILFVAAVLYNFGFSGPGFVSSNIQPDVSDIDEMITGRRREGVISTFDSFIRKLVSGTMSGIVGMVLSLFGFQTGKADQKIQQTATAIFGLRITFIILPVLFSVLCYLGIFKYSMTKGEHEMICAAIKEKKETGTVSLNAQEKKRCEEIAGQRFEEMWIGKPAGEERVFID